MGKKVDKSSPESDVSPQRAAEAASAYFKREREKKTKSKEDNKPSIFNVTNAAILAILIAIIAASQYASTLWIEVRKHISSGRSDRHRASKQSPRHVQLDEKQPPPLDGHLNITLDYETIKRVQWRSGKSFLRSIVKANKPVVIENGPVSSWPLFQLNLLNTKAKGGDVYLERTRFSKKPVFTLSGERDVGGMLGSANQQDVVYTNISLTTFVKTLFNADQYLYWTGELASFEEQLGMNLTSASGVGGGEESSEGGNSASNASWKALMFVEEGLKATIESDDDVWVPMLWLSHPGVVAQMHYDTNHNFFAQVQGYKRFLIASPEQELYSYPNLHRSFRQSQVRFEVVDPSSHQKNASSLSPEAQKEALKKFVEEMGEQVKFQQDHFPMAHNITLAAVDLSPGDMIYIPPYYSHRVESKSMSISLSVISPSLMEANLQETSYQKVPFAEFSSTPTQRVAAVSRFLLLLFDFIRELDSTGGDMKEDETLASFSMSLYKARYEALFPIGKFPPQTDASMILGHTIGINADKKDKDKTTAIPNDFESSLLKENLVANTDSFTTATKKVAMLLKIIPASPGVKRTFLRDYIEQISRWAVGPQNVPQYLVRCLGVPSTSK